MTSKFFRDISVTNALTGQVIRVVRVESDRPISKSDAIHEVIKRNLDS
jgi:spore coat polysaccharide biosynthesis protein SpsF (cytidylyltransferase family)